MNKMATAIGFPENPVYFQKNHKLKSAIRGFEQSDESSQINFREIDHARAIARVCRPKQNLYQFRGTHMVMTSTCYSGKVFNIFRTITFSLLTEISHSVISENFIPAQTFSSFSIP